MGLTLWRLLEYFSVDDLKLALSVINVSQSGSRQELIERLMIEWPEHNKPWDQLLMFLDKPTLSRICNDYSLDHHGNRDVLHKRIKKELPKSIKSNVNVITVGGEGTHQKIVHPTRKYFIYGIIAAAILTGVAMWWNWYLTIEDIPPIIIANDVKENLLPEPKGDLTVTLESARYYLGDVVEGQILNANPSQPYKTRIFNSDYEEILRYDSKDHVILDDGTNKIGFQPGLPSFTTGRYFVVVDDGLELGITSFEIIPKS